MALAVLMAGASLSAPALTSHNDMMTRLAALELADRSVGQGRMTLLSIGRSVQGREIPMVVLVNQGVPLEKTARMFVMCRQHGDEPATTEAMLKLITDLVTSSSEEDADLLDRVSLFIVPMVNPDGAERKQRRNANGMDLNRDWIALAQPETRAVRSAIDRIAPEVIVDAHELSPTNRGSDYLQCAGPSSGASSEVVEESVRIQSLMVGMLQIHGIDVTSYHIDNWRGRELAHRHFPHYTDTKTFLLETRQSGARSKYIEYRMHLHIIGTMTIAKYLAGREGQLAQRIADWRLENQRMLASRGKRRPR